MRSIQGRLALSLGLILLICGVLLINVSIWLLDAGLRRYLETDLRADAQSLLGALERADEGLRLDERRLSSAYSQPLSGYYFAIDGNGQSWRSRSLWDWQLDSGQQPALQQRLIAGPQQQQLLVYRLDARRGGADLVITTARDYQPLAAAFNQLRWMLSGLWALALLLILLLQHFSLRAAFKPLRAAEQQVQQLQQGQRSRLELSPVRELLPLTEQINRLLQHTEQRLQRTRDAIGNLGHALKTPLAVLRSQLARDSVNLAQMNEQLAQIEQRLSRELNQARLSGEALPAAFFHPEKELGPLTDTIRLLHPHVTSLDWRVSAGLQVPYEREDMLEVLGNLLDNAGKWAQQRISLQVQGVNGQIKILIEDDGPGIAPELREQCLSRGQRLDEQVQGHGLGLAIVRDTVQVWGGSIQLSDASLGGLAVELLLPQRLHTGRVE